MTGGVLNADPGYQKGFLKLAMASETYWMSWRLGSWMVQKYNQGREKRGKSEHGRNRHR